MIYSSDIDKKCAVCVHSDGAYCVKKKRALPDGGNACEKFSYDILKRHVRRARKLSTDFTPEDFTL